MNIVNTSFQNPVTWWTKFTLPPQRGGQSFRYPTTWFNQSKDPQAYINFQKFRTFLFLDKWVFENLIV